MKRIGKNETTEINTVKKCFVALEAALYLLFLALDAFSTGGDGVKYLTIVVCLLAAVWSAQHGGSRLMAWAMAFTLAADTFLLLLDRWYGMGIALFCVVQGLYLTRIRRACGHTLWVLRAGLVAAAWPLLSALGMGTVLNLLAALYFVNFLVNAFQSLTLRSERLFAAGLWLFLLVMWVFVAAAGLLLTGAVVCRLRRQRLPRLGGRTPGFWAACGLGGLFLLIALLAALDFDRAFTVFHSIFFPGKDNWLFDPVTDPVILILPEAFFRNCAIAIVTVLLTVCIMLAVTGRKRPSRRSAPGEGAVSR